MDPIIDKLLASSEPSIRYKVRIGVLGEDPTSRSVRKLRGEIKDSPRVQTLLAGRDTTGQLPPLKNVYSKWTGAHWVLASLADIGYPAGDKDLLPLRDQILDTWLDPQFFREIVGKSPTSSVRAVGILNGRARRCASQQGNALYAIVTLGLSNERCGQLVERLLHWQWPDGGWNCDRDPNAAKSSFWETLTPLRGLAAYARATGDKQAGKAAARAAEVFLTRQLFRRCKDGQVMNPQFLRLHYPCYWHYDILFVLKVMAEAGFIHDKRCQLALEELERKRLPDGGWPAEERLYTCGKSRGSGIERVDWGGVSKRKMNEWVTTDALYVLAAAGR